MVNFAIVALDGCYGSSLHGLVDVLVVANAHIKKQTSTNDDYFNWEFVSFESSEVTTSNGLLMTLPKYPDFNVKKYDVIFLPGILYRGAKPFKQQLEQQTSLYQWLTEQHKNGAIISANCTATFFLAESGLLTNKSCTTIWWLEHLFKQYYPDIDLGFNQLIIEDERIITAGAATSHFQLGLQLLRSFTTEKIVQLTSKAMLIDTRKVYVSPEQLLNVAREHNNKLLQQAQDWIEQNLSNSFTVKQMAAELATTERTINRHFNDVLATSPIKYITNLRINSAKYLLEHSELTLEQIIDRVGYRDRSSFSKVFKKYCGLPPVSYRRQFKSD